MFQVIGLALVHKPIVEVPICLRLFIIVPILLGDVLILFAVRRTHCLCQIPKWQTPINNFKLLCTKSLEVFGTMVLLIFYVIYGSVSYRKNGYSFVSVVLLHFEEKNWFESFEHLKYYINKSIPVVFEFLSQNLQTKMNKILFQCFNFKFGEIVSAHK